MARVSAMQAQREAAAGRNAPTEAATAAPSSIAKPKSREGRVHVGAWLPESLQPQYPACSGANRLVGQSHLRKGPQRPIPVAQHPRH